VIYFKLLTRHSPVRLLGKTSVGIGCASDLILIDTFNSTPVFYLMVYIVLTACAKHFKNTNRAQNASSFKRSSLISEIQGMSGYQPHLMLFLNEQLA